MSRTHYTLQTKINVLDAIKQGQNIVDIIYQEDVSAYMIKKWQRDEATIRQAYREQLLAKMTLAQHQIADKTLALIQAMDKDRIAKAPLNQISSALGVLVDRFLKLHDADFEQDEQNIEADDTAEQVIRIEYYDASTGKVSEAPPWAEDNPEPSGTVQGNRVREAIRQDDDSTDYRNGKSHTWDAGLVAGTDVSDGESGLARFEADDDERDWYHD